jgi:hypothetical protein
MEFNELWLEDFCNFGNSSRYFPLIKYYTAVSKLIKKVHKYG